MKNTEVYVEEILDCLGCEYKLIEDAEDTSMIMAEYKRLMTEGKAEGFTPIIVIPNENMYDIVKNRETNAIIENSKSVDPRTFFNEWTPEDMPDNQDMIGEVTEFHRENGFTTLGIVCRKSC